MASYQRSHPFHQPRSPQLSRTRPALTHLLSSHALTPLSRGLLFPSSPSAATRVNLSLRLPSVTTRRRSSLLRRSTATTTSSKTTSASTTSANPPLVRSLHPATTAAPTAPVLPPISATLPATTMPTPTPPRTTTVALPPARVTCGASAATVLGSLNPSTTGGGRESSPPAATTIAGARRRATPRRRSDSAALVHVNRSRRNTLSFASSGLVLSFDTRSMTATARLSRECTIAGRRRGADATVLLLLLRRSGRATPRLPAAASSTTRSSGTARRPTRPCRTTASRCSTTKPSARPSLSAPRSLRSTTMPSSRPVPSTHSSTQRGRCVRPRLPRRLSSRCSGRCRSRPPSLLPLPPASNSSPPLQHFEGSCTICRRPPV